MDTVEFPLVCHFFRFLFLVSLMGCSSLPYVLYHWLDSRFIHSTTVFLKISSFLNLFYWLWYYSCPNFPSFAPAPISTPQSLRQSPHHCSRPRVTCIISLVTPFPILYFASPWLFCNYLFVFLNPFSSSPIPPYHHPIW